MTTLKPIDPTRILARSEIVAVIQDLRRRGRRSTNSQQNLVIFRLAACCGLRVSEIVGLHLSDVRTTGQRPHIRIPARIAKRRRTRVVPLWWDVATLADLTAWKQYRTSQGATGADPFLCALAAGKVGTRLTVRNAQARWKVAIRCLGDERVAVLSIHCGRHSFCSHALAGGRTIVDVRDAAGHANISTTSIYLHVIRDDDDQPGNLFSFEK